MQEPDMSQNESEPLPTPSQEGYCIHIYVTPEGYRVSDPEPLEEETSEESESPEQSGDLVTDKTMLVKHLLHVLAENPIGQDAEAQMQEGYTGKPAAE